MAPTNHNLSYLSLSILLLLSVGYVNSLPLMASFSETRPVTARLAQRDVAVANMQKDADASPDRLTKQLPPKQLILPGEYIVTVAPSADIGKVLQRHAKSNGATVKSTFSIGGLKGFSVQVQVPAQLGGNSNAVPAAFLADADVAALEPVTLMWHAATQTGPSWGLDRIDDSSLPMDGRYTFLGDASAAGAGVWIYILDSGVRWNHTNFEGRGRPGTFWPYVGVTNNLDNLGHGTHVAGIAASQRYGVAKGANIVSVKVLDDQGLGTSDAVVAGINWVLQDKRVANHRKVINLSMTGSPSEALEAAIYQAYLAGVTLVAAAGNDNADACFYTPARAKGLLTVAATVRTDARADFSNVGPCVDLFAPGVSISSLGHTNDTARGIVKTGTSMSSPFVAGVAARIIASGSCGSAVESNDCVYDSILSQATRDKVTGKGARTPNRLLHRSAYLP